MQQPAKVRYPRRNILAITVLLLATALAFIALFNLIRSSSSDSQQNSSVTISGTTVCLPHKNSGEVITLECALGLKGDDGRYFALTEAPMSLLQEDFSTRVKVKGMLLEPESNNKYDISGNLVVESYAK